MGILRGVTGPRRARIRLASLAFALLASAGCRSLPQADRGGELHWPAGWAQRDAFVRGELHLLAASQDDANEALHLYETMLTDLEDLDLAPPPSGLVFVIGGDEEPTLEELERILGELAPDELRADFERDRARQASSNPDEDDPPPEVALAMAAIPLDVDKVLELLRWNPATRPRWAITLPTTAATRRALDAELARQDAGLVMRAAFALMRSRLMKALRQAGLTRTLVQVAYPELSEDEREALVRKLGHHGDPPPPPQVPLPLPEDADAD